MAKILRNEIKLSLDKNFDECIEDLYKAFLEDFQDKNLRPKINGKFVFVDFNKKTAQKPNIFWHLIGLDVKHSFQVLPCRNTKIQKYCNKNCKLCVHQKLKRNICLYRGVRLVWVLDVLNIYNNNPNDSRIKWYVEPLEGRNRLKIIYHDDTDEVVDFIVILEEYGENYKLITGFIMFYENSINDCEKKFMEYHQKLKSEKVLKFKKNQKKSGYRTIRMPGAPFTTR